MSQNHAAAFWRRPPVQRRMADAEAAFQRGDSLPTELLAALNERVEQIPDIVSSTYVCVGNPAVSSTPPEQQGALAGIPLSIKDLFDSWSSRPSCTIPLYANA
ncbi:hypothetical protein [Marinobacterium rhizophilum]|uniref:Amidase n=1 Tax=Marinobacterium rhizophilum TaxID=420402 RepID=A0ABY5HFW7_9GAMM|nr:hypothetical protein [Marinobacterium rhizophilum]UTW11247.1 hypothetical protein KDW95_18555 [Marinobacterium rhizophilum]